MNQKYDPYIILGVAPNAPMEDIKAAYRKLARSLNPENNPNNLAAARQFREVELAYGTLSDPTSRKKYDDTIGKERENEHYFTLQVTPSKRNLAILSEPQVVYLLAEIYPDPRLHDQQERTSRLNLTLVLDRSNSMKGTRLEKVKIAAHQIIDNMGQNDFISIITFNDRAEIVIDSTPVVDKPTLKARVSMINAAGGTEIYKGLLEGVNQTRQNLTPRLVNHIILLTDGHTFGDQDDCIELAGKAMKEGIGISVMGLGNDWNDEFLDELASKTGGSSQYINSAAAVVKFLNGRVRNLVNAFAEQVELSIVPDPDIVLESVFRLSPNPQPIPIEGESLLIGSLQVNRPISVLLQLQIPGDLPEGKKHIVNLLNTGNILMNKHSAFSAASSIDLNMANDPPPEDTPAGILDALSKLALYRLQERAQDSLADGNVNEATRRLENLATRLMTMGQDELAHQALSEARRVAHTAGLSDKGRKALKYQTRYLIADSEDDV